MTHAPRRPPTPTRPTAAAARAARRRSTSARSRAAAPRPAARRAGVPEPPLEELIPANLLRDHGPPLPEVSEPEIVRHYNRLSRRNFDLDTGPYPLGSCTMKHNPRLNERVAALPGHARLHPAQDPKRAQGALELMWNLERALSEICGLPHVSLQPSAGSHGELAGLLLTRAYHADRGEQRTKVLTPDTAHGTNPATVTMAGYEVVKVETNERGGVDLDDLRAKATDEVACLMLTNPNTLGLFDENIAEIASIVHGVGGTLYYDGANLNAIMGCTRPGDMGFDIVHLNLHKSFSQPHGGGGPGRRADRGLRADRALPAGAADRRAAEGAQRRRAELRPRLRRAEVDRPAARLPGQLRRLRALLRLHLEPRRRRPRARPPRPRCSTPTTCSRGCAQGRAGKYLPLAFDRTPMHEFVLSGAPAKRELGVEDARRRQAAARLRLPPADDLLPAAGRRGADGRADRDRDPGVARPARRRVRRDPRRGRAGPRDPPRTRPTRRRCAASTRPRRAASRSSASRSD